MNNINDLIEALEIVIKIGGTVTFNEKDCKKLLNQIQKIIKDKEKLKIELEEKQKKIDAVRKILWW